METNQIVKTVVLKAPRSRVWRAITNADEFGSWFGMKLEGPFTANAKILGAIMPTTVDPEVARLQKPHEGKKVQLLVEKIEPEVLFSFRWHPFAIDPKIDYSKEPTTLVSFRLEQQSEGVLLTITESGFEHLPASRRSDAIKANEGGWAKQTELIPKYLLARPS